MVAPSPGTPWLPPGFFRRLRLSGCITNQVKAIEEDCVAMSDEELQDQTGDKLRGACSFILVDPHHPT